MVGCAFFALPAGILGSGFALQVAKQKKEKRYTKIKNPAAVVIQTLWRNHCVKRTQYQLQGTWNYLFPQIIGSTSRPGYHALLPGIHAIHDSQSFDTFRTSVGRKKTTSSQQRWKKITSSSINPKHQSSRRRSSAISAIEDADMELMPRPGTIRSKINTVKGWGKKKSGEKLPISRLISDRYKAAIRFTLRVKYFTCIQNFKNHRYPFVNVQDIMEKNSHDHLETLAYLNEIRKVISEFRTELTEMRAFFDEFQIAFKSSPILYQKFLSRFVSERNEDRENDSTETRFSSEEDETEMIFLRTLPTSTSDDKQYSPSAR